MPVESDTFHWTEAYRVNIALLDQQHQKLFRTVNDLDQALRVGEGNANLDSILNQLVGYALVHFEAEELLMEKYGFPGLLTHRTQHQMFRDRMAHFLEDRNAAKPGVPVALMLFMQGWLKQHVLKTDKLYSAFLKAHGVR